MEFVDAIIALSDAFGMDWPDLKEGATTGEIQDVLVSEEGWQCVDQRVLRIRDGETAVMKMVCSGSVLLFLFDRDGVWNLTLTLWAGWPLDWALQGRQTVTNDVTATRLHEPPGLQLMRLCVTRRGLQVQDPTRPTKRPRRDALLRSVSFTLPGQSTKRNVRQFIEACGFWTDLQRRDDLLAREAVEMLTRY